MSRYELDAIDEKFSDEYSSINDEDSSNEDLPEHLRNYVLDYLNLKYSEDVQMEPKIVKIKDRDGRNPNISKFRQVRFKSIEEAVDETDN